MLLGYDNIKKDYCDTMGFTDGYYTTKTVKHDCLELYFYEFLQYAKCGQFVISDIDNLAENMGDVIEDQLKKAA